MGSPEYIAGLNPCIEKESAFMEMSLERLISEMEMDEYLIDECPDLSSEFDEYVQLLSPPDDNLQQSSSTSGENNASTMTTATTMCGGTLVEICRTSFERPPKHCKTDNSPNDPITTEHVNENMETSLEQKDEVLCNGDTNNNDSNGGNKNNSAPKNSQNRSNNAITRTPFETQDRVMAERKRREKISQRFIALSAMVPGLKKMDKATVLGDAIKYLKQLQENVKILEQKINKKTEESVAFTKKSHICLGDDMSSCDENFGGHMKEALPEIEARISEKSVFIRIHSKKQKGFCVKLLSEIEKLNLTVVNSSFLPFGLYVDITLVAQMEAEFSMTAKELVRNIRSAFLKFI